MSAAADQWTVNCSILYTDRPLLERPAAAAADGFDAVEFWWPFPVAVPADHDVEAFVRAVRDAGVQLTGLNFFAGNMPGGDRGLVSWPARATQLRDNIPVVASIGEQLGCRAFNALYGNRVDEATPAQQDDLAIEQLAACAAGVAGIGGTVLLEPVSGASRYPLLRADDAVAVLDRVVGAGASNVGLLADLYHLAVNGDDVASAIDRHGARIAHVQIADAPGRGAPGTGTLALTDWLERIRAAGYSGRIGLEYTAGDGDPFAWLDAAAPRPEPDCPAPERERTGTTR